MLRRTTPFALITLLCCGFSLVLSSCLKDKCEAVQSYTQFDPVWLLPEEMRTIELEAPRPLASSGKIYAYLDLLFINEPFEGVHIFDNQNPETPVSLGFLSIPGNVDIAIRNGMMYADNGPDLVTFSLADPTKPELVNRQMDVFEQFYSFSDQGILLYWEPSDVTIEVPCDNPWWGEEVFFSEGRPFVRADAYSGQAALPANTVGTGGSLARFTILDSWLYTIDLSSLQVFSLDNASQPNSEGIVQIGWGIETIFPYGDHLFIGANNGMYIFNATDRRAPFQQSLFQHAQACDPVFVDGDVAYVTLRDGTECQNFINQLDVVDISDLSNPSLMATYPMHHPIGLSVVDEWLYLCDDDQGLKIFDREPMEDIGNGPVHTLQQLSAIDIIALPQKDLALVIGLDGLHQYDISNRSEPRFLSLIPVSN